MKLVNLYDRLSAEERFKAAVSAASRRDTNEWDRLNDTSPVRSIRVQEPSYFARVRELWQLSLLHSSTARGCRMKALLAVSVLLSTADSSDSSDSEHESANEHAATDETEPSTQDQLSDSAQTLLAHAKGLERGFDDFCATLGINTTEVRGAFGLENDEYLNGFLSAIAESFNEGHGGAADMIALEESERQAWLAKLTEMWATSIDGHYGALERAFQMPSTRKN